MHGPASSLCQALVDRLPLVSAIHWHDEVTSTNALLIQDATTTPTGTVHVADVQTAGRGRRGRNWYAPPGTSLMLSILLRPGLPRASWPLLTLMAGSALIQACRLVIPDDPARLALKWPNDLLLDGVKAAGILTESSDNAVVMGIGINTDWRSVQVPAGVQATSLAHATGGDIDRWQLLDHVLGHLDTHYLQAQADPGGVVRRYIPDCATLGSEVTAHATPPVKGRAVGLTPDGHLRIRTSDGRERVVTAGDVEHLR
ncbi:MAG: biotin--[acetyl-CoA-carboxylase] ligase [Euzebya sp.]